MTEQRRMEPRLRVVVPEVSDGQVADDLVWLTEHLMSTQGAETTGGFLGGEFGYGADFENDTFQMHPYCWCESDACPWCWGCVCPEGASVYEVRGTRVTFDEWCAEYERTGNRDRTHRKDPDLVCDYCTGERVSAPNFWHKPTDSRVHWYKYIGRSMDVTVHGEWRTILADCVASLTTDPQPTPPCDENARSTS